MYCTDVTVILRHMSLKRFTDILNQFNKLCYNRKLLQKKYYPYPYYLKNINTEEEIYGFDIADCKGADVYNSKNYIQHDYIDEMSSCSILEEVPILDKFYYCDDDDDIICRIIHDGSYHNEQIRNFLVRYGIDDDNILYSDDLSTQRYYNVVKLDTDDFLLKTF